jgi:hypothetical protein
MDDTYEIKQIIPAPGWFAVWLDEDGFFLQPLACWALRRKRVDENYYEAADDEIVGMVNVDVIQSAEEDPNFYEYVFENEVTDKAKEKWQLQVARRWEARQSKALQREAEEKIREPA